jgi:hypothetical protein
VIALYLGVTQPRDRARGIASEKASGLAAVSGGAGWEPMVGRTVLLKPMLYLWGERRTVVAKGTAQISSKEASCEWWKSIRVI